MDYVPYPHKKGTKEERRIIIECYYMVKEEFYYLLELDQLETEPTANQIIEVCQERIRFTNESNYSSGEKDYITECYNKMQYILTNPRLKSVYLNEFFVHILNHVYNRSKYFKVQLIMNGVLDIIKYPLKRISMITASRDGIVSTIRIGKEMYKHNGLFGLFKNSVLSILPINSTLSILLKQANFNNGLDEIIALNAVCSLIDIPYSFMVSTVMLSPLSMSFLNIIKDIVLRKQVGGKLELGAFIIYTFRSTLALYAIKHTIDWSIDFIESLIADKRLYNPNSNFWKCFEKVWCNPIVNGVLKSFFMFPLEVISCQYQMEYILSAVNGLPIPSIVNPISMAIKIVNQQSYKMLYNGVMFYGIPIILKKFCDNLFPFLNSLTLRFEP